MTKQDPPENSSRYTGLDKRLLTEGLGEALTRIEADTYRLVIKWLLNIKAIQIKRPARLANLFHHEGNEEHEGSYPSCSSW
jgi:hypothetical protein